MLNSVIQTSVPCTASSPASALELGVGIAGWNAPAVVIRPSSELFDE
jgi:hypothetical protein